MRWDAMKIVVVKTDPERVWVTRADGTTVQVPVRMSHDLPHLVVESVFGLPYGLWGLINVGAFVEDIRVFGSRDRTRAWTSVLPARLDDPMYAAHAADLHHAKLATNTVMAVVRGWSHDSPEQVASKLGIDPE